MKNWQTFQENATTCVSPKHVQVRRVILQSFQIFPKSMPASCTTEKTALWTSLPREQLAITSHRSGHSYWILQAVLFKSGSFLCSLWSKDCNNSCHHWSFLGAARSGWHQVSWHTVPKICAWSWKFWRSGECGVQEQVEKIHTPLVPSNQS